MSPQRIMASDLETGLLKSGIDVSDWIPVAASVNNPFAANDGTLEFTGVRV
jgi:hypothetical protein